MTTLTHINADPDLEKAKDGRWVLLVEPDLGGGVEDGPTWNDNHIPPVVVAKWVPEAPGQYGGWSYMWAKDQVEGFLIYGAAGFVELSDLGLYHEEPDDSNFEVASDGTAELVHPDGRRVPAPDGWDEGGLKAVKLE